MLVVLTALAAYVASYYFLPRSLGGNYWPPESQSLGNAIYNVFYFPMRWVTQREMRQDNVTVYQVNPEKREVLLIYSASPFPFPYRASVDAKMRELRPGDRIRATTQASPHFLYGIKNVVLWDYARLPDATGNQR